MDHFNSKTQNLIHIFISEGVWGLAGMCVRGLLLADPLGKALRVVGSGQRSERRH